MTKYSLEEIKNNLEKLRNKLKKKEIQRGFWIIASRKDFKPLIKEVKTKEGIKKENIRLIKDIREILLKDNGKKFSGKKLAFIRIWIDEDLFKDTKKYNQENFKNIKNNFGCSVIIHIYEVDDYGKIGHETKRDIDWMCRINFTIDDLSKHKLVFKNVETLMRQASEQLAVSTDMLGFLFKDYKKIVKKKLEKNKKN